MKHLKNSSLLIIALNLIGWGTFGFLVLRLHDDAERVIAAYQELYAAARESDDLRFTSATLGETASARVKIATAWLRSKDLILFIEKLEGLAKTTEVVLKLDEPKPIGGDAPRLTLAFHGSGSFSALHHFLVLLENLPYRFEWQRSVWSFQSGTTWSADFQLTLVSYTETNVTP